MLAGLTCDSPSASRAETETRPRMPNRRSSCEARAVAESPPGTPWPQVPSFSRRSPSASASGSQLSACLCREPRYHTLEISGSELFLPSTPAHSKRRSLGTSRMAGSLLARSPSSPHLTLVQDLPHFGTQLSGGKGLLDEVHSLVQHAVLGDDVGCVPRNEQAFEAWTERE